MSWHFTGECRGCGGTLRADPPGEEENHDGISVRCGRCGTTTCLRPDGAGRIEPKCPFYTGRWNPKREMA